MKEEKQGTENGATLFVTFFNDSKVDKAIAKHLLAAGRKFFSAALS